MKICPEWSVPGYDNVEFEPFVKTKEDFLSTLHLKLGLWMKIIVQDTNVGGDGFKYLKEVFIKVSAVKLKEGNK